MLTVVVSVSILLAGFTSGLIIVTVALLVILPAAAGAVTAILIGGAAPAGAPERVQVTLGLL